MNQTTRETKSAKQFYTMPVLLLMLLVSLMSSVACAQEKQDTDKQGYDPDWAKTDAGAPAMMDFSISLDGISDPGILFSHFTQRYMVVFYFSPKCPHCLQTYPKVQSLIDKYSSFGLSGIAVSVSNARKNEIRAFVNELNISIPMFQDSNRDFSAKYGSGHVPLIVLVAPDGKYIRYTQNGPNMLSALEQDIKEAFEIQ